MNQNLQDLVMIGMITPDMSPEEIKEVIYG